MKKLLFLGVVSLFSACTSSQQEVKEEQSTITLVDIGTFHELMENKDLQIVDVRTAQEHELSSIPGSINIDYWSKDFTQEVLHLDKQRPVAVYCAAGARSAKAATKLKDLGFKEIYDLDGGMRAWHTGPPASVRE